MKGRVQYCIVQHWHLDNKKPEKRTQTKYVLLHLNPIAYLK